MEYTIKVIGAPGAYDTLQTATLSTEEKYYVRECDIFALAWNNKEYVAIAKNTPITNIPSKDFCIKVSNSGTSIIIDVKGKILVRKMLETNPEEKYFMIEHTFEPPKKYTSGF